MGGLDRLLLDHAGCTLLGTCCAPKPPKVVHSPVGVSERNAGCGWDELLRAGMRTCQAVRLQCMCRNTVQQMAEKGWYVYCKNSKRCVSALL